MEELKGWRVERAEIDSSGRACYRIATSLRVTQRELHDFFELISAAPNMLNSLQETAKSISLMKGCLSKLTDDTRELEDIMDNWRFRNQEVINKALVQTSN